MLRSLLLLGSVAAFAVGCGHPVDSAASKIDSTIDSYCQRCADEIVVSETQCLALLEGYRTDDGEVDCLRSVADRHESANPYFSCVDDKAGEYQSCVDSAGCNQVAIENCGSILDSISDTCPLPSGDASEEIQACYR